MLFLRFHIAILFHGTCEEANVYRVALKFISGTLVPPKTCLLLTVQVCFFYFYTLHFQWPHWLLLGVGCSRSDAWRCHHLYMRIGELHRGRLAEFRLQGLFCFVCVSGVINMHFSHDSSARCSLFCAMEQVRHAVTNAVVPGRFFLGPGVRGGFAFVSAVSLSLFFL